jgi:hypothetical protein
MRVASAALNCHALAVTKVSMASLLLLHAQDSTSKHSLIASMDTFM